MMKSSTNESIESKNKRKRLLKQQQQKQITLETKKAITIDETKLKFERMSTHILGNKRISISK